MNENLLESLRVADVIFLGGGGDYYVFVYNKGGIFHLIRLSVI